MPPAGIVNVTGGVGRSGGVRIALPSPAGTWNPQWTDQKVDFDRDEFTRFIADKGDVKGNGILVDTSAATAAPNGGVG